MLQQYWWLVVSLLAALLVFLLFVQGGQTFIFRSRKDATLQKMLINSTGRKWEFTLTTLVRRCFLCFISTLLLHFVWWSLLGMDTDLPTLRTTGSIL